ncbi:uncharacterized protein LOC127834233 isoform X3 [Dreissena polymorpha]|uniref:uncharacterized protein LOC127834233 isoform X3 n=1 Tax=Dreissena polymorpha TaxID=45954 RepID=UPI0022655236|nr:uncharacterized protein LOC127834233 isoform X3 [Dreissena polymorpha]
MASNFETSIHRGSDLFFDFSCYTCKGNDRNTEAEFYCEDCCKIYCGKCLEHHNFLYQKHVTLDKKNFSKWPVSDATFDVLEQCEVHKNRKLETFCEDHSALMCTVCHVYNHKKCSHFVLIADKVKDLHQKGEFKQLSATLDTLHRQLIMKKDDLEESLKSLEQAYNTILEEINALRKAINDSLDQLERNTIKELDTLLAKLRTSIQTDNANCNESIKKMTSVKEDWLTMKGKSEAIQMIIYRKCLDMSLKTKAVLQEMTVENDITLSFTPDPIILQTMATLSGLGQILTENRVTKETKPEACCALPIKSDPEIQASETNKQDLVTSPVLVLGTPRQAEIANQTSALNKLDTISNQASVPHKQYHTVTSSSSTQLVQRYLSSAHDKSDPNQIIRMNRMKTSKMYNVKIEKDSEYSWCYITGICEIATGELLITNNRKVKLLDQTMKVVTHYDLPSNPLSTCSIDSSLVAVAMYIKEIIFIRVTNRKLVKDRTMEFQHLCHSIAHHQGNLFITTVTALYQYTVDGRLLRKLYEDTRGTWTVGTCAVSPDGERIYVTNYDNKLVTLSRDGTVISTLSDPALMWGENKPGLHVTDTGQVLVCGGWSNTIIQVDTDGGQRLADVVTEKDNVRKPTCVYYSKHTGILVVGMSGDNCILVFSTC